jgi:tRNA-uridine 2-sulfurtransferase
MMSQQQRDGNKKQQQKEGEEGEEKKPKAVALLSGGLDSTLAVKIMLEQGIDIEAIAIKTPFCDFDCGRGCGQRVKEVADELGVKLKTLYFGKEYLRMLKNPKYGYGSCMNPCIDCRGMMYNAAKEHMKKTNADFVITGEVLFQRPMSQNNRALHIIEKETGMERKVLRPLSAKHLPPTDAEKMGLINREHMGDIKGRSRKGQLMLAKHFGISEPPNAAGGCLLTDPSFSKRVKDILDHCDDIPTLNDIELLKVGRHFRIRHDAKLVVGRNKDENEVIKTLVADGDIIIEVKDYVGPTCIFRCKNYNDSLIVKSAAIAARYSDAPKNDLCKVLITINGDKNEVTVMPADIASIEMMRI